MSTPYLQRLDRKQTFLRYYRASIPEKIMRFKVNNSFFHRAPAVLHLKISSFLAPCRIEFHVEEMVSKFEIRETDEAGRLSATYIGSGRTTKDIQRVDLVVRVACRRATRAYLPIDMSINPHSCRPKPSQYGQGSSMSSYQLASHIVLPKTMSSKWPSCAGPNCRSSTRSNKNTLPV